MKNALLWLALFAGIAGCTSAQTPVPMSEFDYATAWQRIDTLVSENKVRDAMKVAETIMAKAKAEGESAQEVKALLHTFVLSQPTEEKADSLIEQKLKQAITSSEFPVKNLLHAYLGEFYWKYYQRNRWRINQRTAVLGSARTDNDFEEWDVQTLMAEAGEQFIQALEQPDGLFDIDIKKYELLINEGHESKKYRPTLYDLLANRALDFYENSETSLPQPQVLFTLKQADAFAPAKKFAKIKFPDADDAGARDLIATRLFQDLIERHYKANNVAALVDVDLRRLDFAKDRAVGPNRDEAYRDALKELLDKNTSNPASTLAAAKLAAWYVEKAGSNPPPNKEHARDYVIAEQICLDAIAKHPKSEGAGTCQGILNGINQKDLNLRAEEILPINEDFRFLLGYRNLKRAFIRVAKLTPAAKKRIANYDWNERKAVAKVLAKLTPLQTWDTGLPGADDHHPHSAEVIADGLESGDYIILASDNADFAMTEHTLVFLPFTVSDLAFVGWGIGDSHEVYVRDRMSGKVVKKAKVKAESFSWRRGQEKGKQFFSGKTGKHGEVSFETPKDENRIKLYFQSKKEKDRYETDKIYTSSYSDRSPRTVKQIAFFLDRTIYRPGQTIYVKGLVMENTGDKHRILPKYATSIKLFDVNGQEVQSLDVTTNEYGTFSTTFTAPGALTGQMSVRCEMNSHSFRVEDYKRPTFEVKMEKPEGEVSLGETIMVTGTATAYAGNAIDGAEVKYRVVREARFPYWGWRWWLPRPSSPSREIASGTLTSKPDGTFKVPVELIPDATLDPSTQPVFSYTVFADVVDIAGETHSAQTAVRAGYIGLELETKVPGEVMKGKPVTIKLIAKNLSGGEAKAKVDMKQFRLIPPASFMRNRKWNAPDQHLYTEADWKKRLPLEEFAEEDKIRNWKTEGMLGLGEIQVDGEYEFTLEGSEYLAPGMYRLEFTSKDSKGNEVKTVSQFTINDPKSKRPPIPSLLYVDLSKKSLEPGETLKVNLRTSLPSPPDAIVRVMHGNELIEKRYVKLKGLVSFEVPIKEAYRGGIDVQVTGLGMNQPFGANQHIDVPWTNKQLKLEWMSFRSPLEPGSEERWKLKITGEKGEAVAAELVTAMYDASLEAFSQPNAFGLSLYQSKNAPLRSIMDGWGQLSGNVFSEDWNTRTKVPRPHGYDQLNTFGFEYGVAGFYRAAQYSGRALRSRSAGMADRAGEPPMAKGSPRKFANADAVTISLTNGNDKAGEFQAEMATEDADGVPDLYDKKPGTPAGGEENAPVPIRTNLQETAFFFPQLKTNEAGEIELVFTMPEALTKWKLTGLAHTKDLDIGTISGEVVTQKDLMVRPHLPRFMREGDAITLSSRVVNLTDGDLSGEAQLQLLDAVTMKDISAQLGIANASRSFTAKGKQTANVTWDVKVPSGISAVVARVTARAGGKADGEENILPVLSNRMLVTESMPMPVRGAGTRDFTFTKLLNSDQSSSLRHHQLSLEFTPNPAWYAVKALPYLMEYPHECAEQVFSRYYANALASHVANSKPRIKQVFESWKREAASNGGFVAALEQNQDLKAVVMEETPWILDAENDKLRQERIALLFDLNRMADESSRARQQLANMQYNSGGFPWFEKMPESRYITTLIVTGFGHLSKLGVSSAGNPEVAGIVQKALPYLDAQLAKDLRELKRYVKGDKLKENHLSRTQIQYLYMRSFYKDVAIAGNTQEAFDYYFNQAKTYWNAQDSYAQGMISLALNRYGETKIPATIIEGMRQTAVQNDELGMYWKSAQGWFWYQAPIERQALLIEAFDEVAKDNESVEAMKLWLLKNKQTTDWKTTRATVAACNALLLTGTNWLENNDVPTFAMGDAASTQALQSKIKGADKETGSGYFRVNWSGAEVSPEMGKVSVTRNTKSGAAWGAMYWQYFEDLDKITFAETPLSMKKEIYREENTPQGPKLVSIKDIKTPLTAGDKLKIRIELRVDRDMEYVHMKDMRASGLEPIDVLSGYRYQDGLSYYQSTRDAATHFFFSYLRGNQTYVFEYPLRVSHEGDFSNGISTIQCMYAPEFTSHSEGVRIEVKE